MSNRITVKSKDIAWITKHAFTTRKREAIIISSETVYFVNTFWGGGSRNQYKAVKLENGETASLITGESPWNAVAEGTTVKLEPGIAIVEQSIFQGKEMKLSIYVHPDNMVKFLK